MENVTLRKKMPRSKSEMNLSTISNESINTGLLDDPTMLDSTMMSFNSTAPNVLNASNIEELRNEIKCLTKRMDNADKIIENLKHENNMLKRTIVEQEKTMSRNISMDGIKIPSKHDSTPMLKKMLNIIKTAPRVSPLRSDKAVCVNDDLTPRRPPTETSKQDKIRLDYSEATIKENDNNEHTTNDDDLDIKPRRSITAQERTNKYVSENTRKNVIIIGDQQGRNVRRALQNIIGDNYHVTSFFKPNASIGEVVSQAKREIENLTKNDYLVLLCGMNDNNPDLLQIKLNLWLNCVTHTNVIVGEIPNNMYLNEPKLNYTIKFICSRFSHVLYMDMNYCMYMPSRRNFALNMARSLLKEIIHLEYRFKFDMYKLSQLSYSCKLSVNKSTQTDNEPNVISSDDNSIISCINNDTNCVDSIDNNETIDNSRKRAEKGPDCNHLFRV